MSFHHGTMGPVSWRRMRVYTGCFLLLLFSALASSPARSRTWHIKSDGTGDVPTIQDRVGSASSSLVEGFAEVSPGWDFSDSTAVDLYEGDISIVWVADPPIGYLLSAWNGAAVVISDSTFKDLTTAPEDTNLYIQDCPALLGRTYVVRTAESHYAKFEILFLSPVPVIQFAYQPDGSPILTRGVAIEASTWGRMKALYR